MATLDEQYKLVIQEQQQYLIKLQEAFNKRCDEITAEAKAKLVTVPEEDKEGREQIVAEQKQQLEKAREEFKIEVNKSMSDARKKLEEIASKKENSVLDELESEINKM